MCHLISIIVPIYNVEYYLEECVDSLLNQSYRNLEILLVDDGSTDNSGQLCENLKNKDSRISVYHKINGGLSDARNYGIEISRGTYICFVDSDDIVSVDYIESMYNNIINYKCKISACGYCYYYGSGKTKIINVENLNKYYANNEAQKYLNIIGYFNVSACNKLFERELFNDLQFPKDKKSEDWFIMYLLIQKAGGLYYCSDNKYYYRQRVGSITKSVNVNYDCIDAARTVYSYYIQQGWEDAIPFAIQSLIFAYIGVYNANLCFSVDKVQMKKIRNEVQKLKKRIVYDELSTGRKFQLFLFFHSRKMYDLMFRFFDFYRKRQD